MDRTELRKIFLETNFLINFKYIKEDELIKKFLLILDYASIEENIEKIQNIYIDFIEELSLKKIEDFSIYVKNIILSKKFININKSEIEILNKAFNVNYEKIKQVLQNRFSSIKEIFNYLPNFISSNFVLTSEDFTKNQTVDLIEENIYSNNCAFVFDRDLEIKPIEISEKITFSDLKGYCEQKRILYENTLAFIQDKKVNNILLYGDAGCGKSSSVKALMNEFPQIKMIQIFKSNLINLDKLYLKLKDIDYKFIIFADDITFDEKDETLSTMKAVLEGSLIQCPSNVVIYATSNRRHLIKESFQSRIGNEIHLNDTLNEINSLSERFGINLLFSKPTNEEFNQIVIELAHDNNIDMEDKLLIEKAQRLAMIKGSKSPRVAKQLIDNLIAQVNV